MSFYYIFAPTVLTDKTNVSLLIANTFRLKSKSKLHN